MAKTARSEEKIQSTIEEAAETTEPVRSQPSDEEIAVRAYYIYLERGDAEGSATDDWLQAERDLTENT